MRHRRVRAARMALLAMVVAGSSLGVGTGAQAGGSIVNFGGILGVRCQGYGEGPAETTLRIRQRRADGTTVGTFTVTTDENGNWGVTCYPGRLRVGDKLAAFDDDTDEHLRTLTIPNLTPRLDRASDVATGRAPVGTQIAISVQECPALGDTCSQRASEDLTVGGGGTWSFDATGTYDVVGNDLVAVSWSNASGDYLEASDRASYFEVRRGEARMTGLAGLGQTVVGTLRTASGAFRGRGQDRSSALDGAFALTFRANGDPRTVRIGDKPTASFAKDAKLSVPGTMAIDVSDAAADHIAARCAANQRYFLAVIREGGVSQRSGTAAPDGTIDEANLVGGAIEDATVVLWCRSSRGDRVRMERVVA